MRGHRRAVDLGEYLGVRARCGAESLLDEIIGAGGVGSIDMVFCDVGERERYPHMHEQLMQVVRVGGLVVYYDTLWAADQINTHPPFPTMREFAESLSKDPRVIATMVPLSYGFTLCVKAMDLPAKPLEQARDLGVYLGDIRPPMHSAM